MLLLSTALAGTTVGAVGTVDVANAQTLAGIELSSLGEQTQGFRPHVRVMLGVDFVDVQPTGTTELGFTGVVPTDEALIRAGGFVRVDHLVRERLLALQIGSPPEGTPRYGVAVSAGAMAELAWKPEAPVVLGALVGFGHWSGVRPACVGDPDLDPSALPEGCVAWPVSIIASAYLRKTFKNGLMIRARAGTRFELGVGYRFL